MDPARLLDPRGLRRRGGAAAQNGAVPVQAPAAQPAFDPRALLNPRAPKRPASDTQSDRGRDPEDQSQIGQVNLVERLHNVHYRADSPAKRAKTDGDVKSRQHTPVQGGSTLQVNPPNWGSAPIPPPQVPQQLQPPPIDLTMSDDDEVQVMQDNGSQIVCIGRVKQAYVQSHLVPFPDPQKYRGNHGSQGRIKVSFRRIVKNNTNNIMVVDPTGREFGRVDLRTSLGLVPLMDGAKVNGLQWIVSTEPRRKHPNEGAPGTPLSTLIALTLQLYCPRRFAQQIGQFLNSRNIKLGDPQIEMAKYDYFNPQTMASFTVREAEDPAFAEHRYPNGRAVDAAPVYHNLRSQEDIKSDIMQMFDSLEDHANLPLRKQSDRIKTPLLKHQEQALYFMTEKETEWNDEKGERKDALWKAQYASDGRKEYVHVITGKREDKPENVRGGILADEMGLGKTLSILSLIMDEDSLAAAKAFAASPPGRIRQTQTFYKNSRATLLLCPLSTMVNWQNQIRDHFDPDRAPKFLFWHGADRKYLSPESLADTDIVITTYHMVAADALDTSKALGRIHWFRIVLDEAHQIRSGQSQQAVAVYSLAAERRWAVTGTPVQNRLDDMQALFKFLGVKPFDSTSQFKRFISNPFKECDESVVPKLQLLVGSLTLRRLKDGNVVLPKRTDLVVELEFSPDERKLHDWFENDTARQIRAVTTGDKIGGQIYAKILKAILYLRLICAHGRDLLSDEALKLTEGMSMDNPVELRDGEELAPVLTHKAAYEMLDLMDQTGNCKCNYLGCQNTIFERNEDSDPGSDPESDIIGAMTPCYHLVCAEHIERCKDDWARAMAKQRSTDGRFRCESCTQMIQPILFELTWTNYDKYRDDLEERKKNVNLAKKLGAYTGPHTKTKALLEDLRKNAEESAAHPNEPPIKSVVFSCWTTHLDLIAVALDDNGHKYCRLDGRMNRKKRDQSLETFANDPTVPIILVSIGAGGLGLNLTSANKAYVMEPQFNPAAEAQAVDRVHRLGQTREVTIKRFVMRNSFEGKILDLQRKKKTLAELTMGGKKKSKEQVAREKLEDLRTLFR